ncbi:MAG: hypothetical protein IPO50_15820 [Sphingomonadales bacterium]|nr:hypothetical protein [Sphingomonadales bacterium]
MGFYPFHHWPERRICPGDRFNELYQRYGYLAKQFTVFGQHIHVGCTSADDAIWLTQALGVHVPAFVALSASSPFVDGGQLLPVGPAKRGSAFPLSGQCPPLEAVGRIHRTLPSCKLVVSPRASRDLYWADTAQSRNSAPLEYASATRH